MRFVEEGAGGEFTRFVEEGSGGEIIAHFRLCLVFVVDLS
jgi:hypothetical protein